MLRLNRDDLLHIAPRPKSARKAKIWDAYTGALMSPQGADLLTHVAEIATPLRLRHALAQWSGAETGGFGVLYESGAYTEKGILRVFGAGRHSSAITPQEAAYIASLDVYDDGDGPRAMRLFERAYGYKTKIGKQLGNVKEGDGYRCRGLGFNQMTGLWAYQHNASKIGCRVEDLPLAINLLHGACLEWREKGCNKYADKDDAISIRKLINAGTVNISEAKVNGLPQTMQALRRTEAVITAADFSTPTTVVAANDSLPAAPVVDVPGDEYRTAVNPDAPQSIWQSTEMHAATGTTVGGGVTSANEWFDVLPRAFQAATARGGFSVVAFALALLADPVFWAALAASGVTTFGIYLMIQKWKRHFRYGV